MPALQTKDFPVKTSPISPPHIVVWLSSAASLAIALCLSAFNVALMDMVGWLATLAAFGFIYAHLSTSASAAKLLGQAKQLSFVKVATVSASCAVLIFAFVGSVCPLPAYPYNVLPLIFGFYLLGGLVYLRRLKPS